MSIIKLRGLTDSSPEKSVCLTFDDAYQSFLSELLPILQERRLPATVFVITDYVGRMNKWDLTLGVNRRRHLDWEQINEIHQSGIEIGSHCRTHRDLTRLNDIHLNDEIAGSKKVLEDRLGCGITSLALPFGAVNRQIITMARSCGYQEICGGVPGLFGPMGGVLARLPIYQIDGVRALRHKLEMRFFEILKMRLLQSCSKTTRWLKG
ncbi:MAG: polysaccharide deacetylase family protein [bacterium]|nr:polysaccharide deacetylase family protein [bacterium]